MDSNFTIVSLRSNSTSKAQNMSLETKIALARASDPSDTRSDDEFVFELTVDEFTAAESDHELIMAVGSPLCSEDDIIRFIDAWLQRPESARRPMYRTLGQMSSVDDQLDATRRLIRGAGDWIQNAYNRLARTIQRAKRSKGHDDDISAEIAFLSRSIEVLKSEVSAGHAHRRRILDGLKRQRVIQNAAGRSSFKHGVKGGK